jgi:hypothetical protein
MKGERTKAALGVVTAIILVTTIGIASVTSIVLIQTAYAFTIPGIAHEKAPIAISGDNIYVTWWTNKTANNNEVMFRASTDNGATFGNKTNLSNSKGAESVDVQIAASGDNVYVSWWERNQTTANEPVMRVSDDNGKSFGPVLHLAANGTISSGGS